MVQEGIALYCTSDAIKCILDTWDDIYVTCLSVLSVRCFPAKPAPKLGPDAACGKLLLGDYVAQTIIIIDNAIAELFSEW